VNDNPHLGPAVCFGAVMHERLRPVGNRFAYPLFYLRLPLSRLHEADALGLAVDRPGLLSLRLADYGARDGSHPLPWIRTVLAAEGVAAEGEVVLQTLPRMFGHAFNPVSFWFCHDRDGLLRAVLCEVSNTFGERHNYLVAPADGHPIAENETLRARKVFHVSPFFPVRGEYLFRFRRRGGIHSVAIDYCEGGQEMLRTRISGHAQPLSAAALRRAAVRFPLLGLGVIARIHWQALRLWARRVPFFRKPLPPLEQTTR
jgi:hypothetical protein